MLPPRLGDAPVEEALDALRPVQLQLHPHVRVLVQNVQRALLKRRNESTWQCCAARLLGAPLVKCIEGRKVCRSERGEGKAVERGLWRRKTSQCVNGETLTHREKCFTVPWGFHRAKQTDYQMDGGVVHFWAPFGDKNQASFAKTMSRFQNIKAQAPVSLCQSRAVYPAEDSKISLHSPRLWNILRWMAWSTDGTTTTRSTGCAIYSPSPPAKYARTVGSD